MSIQTASQARTQAETRVSTSLQELVESHLSWISGLDEGAVAAWIEDHHVTLTGEVCWTYQREAAEQAVRRLPGVGSVQNRIVVAARTSLRNAEARLRNAMFRDPQIDADLVHVTITGPTAVLTGQVKSLAEKRQAGLAAWISPGVIEVDNRLVVRPPASPPRSRQ
ncbi:BON domain-containing protein [Nesterenkonia sandarakina]|uniref:Osmotically-inducible protein OsmY n=1 Tax=Nesterenkonia sandarakina TaxID=272918 RepID=A0A2T0YJ46_9MICC|nr:BON domain-containing protein [Nesterenkonia sandarakina]PRZ15210.1 osmotically-inducible protein OsmY [Nesterenkonia sandarakina]